MNKIPYEKCICFIFLVILVVLSCSGFPIDNVAMTDTSKKNFRTSSSYSTLSTRSDDFLGRMFNFKSTQNIDTLPSHKLRHLRQLRAQTRDFRTYKMPMGHIDAVVIPPPNDEDSEFFSRSLSQTYRSLPPPPPSSVDNKPRSQRSNKKNHKKKNNSDFQEHFSVKAYKANVVLLVKTQSIQRKRCDSYEVYFKVLDQLKTVSSFPVHGGIQLPFANATGNCRREGKRRRRQLVKANIKVGREYILFLNASSANNYSILGAPELVKEKRKKKMMEVLRNVCRPNFEPSAPRIAEFRSNLTTTKRIKIVCKAAGLPAPQISWRLNNKTITSNRHVRIKYKKRWSTLVIRDPLDSDFGRYECVAHGFDGKKPVFKSEVVVRPKPPHSSNTISENVSRKACDEHYSKHYCLNDGRCFMDTNPFFIYCECPDGFQGSRCENKTPNQAASMYPQTSLYACKLGLSTKYYC